MKRAQLEAFVLDAWTRGMIPLAIATQADTSVDTVMEILKEEGVAVPSFMQRTGGKTPLCSCCGRSLE